MRRLRILTWHVHGSYLYYLSHVPHDWYVVSKPGRPAGYGGRYGHFPWPANLYDMPAEQVRRHEFDVILFQWREHYFRDQFELLSESQRQLPRIYLEHDPPQGHPAFSVHPVQDAGTMLVHVTPFNALMWDSGVTPFRIIEHGVPDTGLRYRGATERGIAVINHLSERGRRLGHDVFEFMRHRVPLDLVGMSAEKAGGLGEVRHDQLPEFLADYRFFFNPIRYTSFGLAVCEAMMTGLPVVGLATTEMAAVFMSGVNGFVDTRLALLEDAMHHLIRDPGLARTIGEAGRQTARERFGLDRFVHDWNRVLTEVSGVKSPQGRPALEVA